MPSDPQRPSWWRIPSPSMLLLVLLLSFLPWIEVGCEKKLKIENPIGGQIGPVKVSVSSSGDKTVVATQSGYQIAVGEHTRHNPFGDLSNRGSNDLQPQWLGDKDRTDAAPLLFVFFISVLVAGIAGFAMQPSRTRTEVVGVSTGTAFAVLLIQAFVLGFPAVNDVAEQRKQVVWLKYEGPFVRYTVWYWLTWTLLVGAFVPLVVEELWTRPLARSSASRRASQSL